MSVAAAGYPQRRTHSALFAHIDVERGSRLTELAARSSVTPQAMSDVVNDLVRLGYVERRPDPDDGRAVLLELTAPGQAYLRKLSAAWHEIVADSLVDWEPREIAKFATMIDRFVANLESSAESA